MTGGTPFISISRRYKAHASIACAATFLPIEKVVGPELL
jgi:hypothetical protein